jgi:anti-sigma factor RsiW
MIACPSDETLAAFIDGRLKGADSRAVVVDHIADCAECRDVVVMADEVRVVEGIAGHWWSRFCRAIRLRISSITGCGE